MKKNISLIFIFIFSLACSSSNEKFTKVEVLAQGTSNPIHTFDAELALSPEARSMGLMFRTELGKNRGMLFVFGGDVTHSFWMQNTLIPLDIIFISSNREIINIVARAEPQTTTPREPAGPYRYVLEIEGGRAEELGIGEGDRVEFALP